MKNLIAVLAISGVLSTPAMAADAMALAKSKNCLACHAMDKKLVGPAFKDIAAKYASDKGAVDKLAVKIMKGGAGVWGAIPMPANNVTDAEAKSLAAWVLTVK
jgi:cytochrome c